MIDRCFNPACKRSLEYLRDGRVVRVIRGKDENTSVEHYWLCGPCFHTHDFEIPADGSVVSRERFGRDHTLQTGQLQFHGSQQQLASPRAFNHFLHL